MKINIKSLYPIGAIILLTFFTGCYYDQVVPEEITIETAISFKDDLVPIFNASCNLVGCHNQGGVTPDLTQGNAYNSLISNGLINVSIPDKSELYLWVTGQKTTPMPIDGIDPLIGATILAWINQGALNN